MLTGAFSRCPAVPLALPSARAMRNSVSRGTGRPVAPFASPETAFVPAISKCAHLNPLANRFKKHAAVMLPAGRPPRLLMSAKLLFSRSWYSSNIGKRHARSPVSLPDSSNCSASSSSFANKPLVRFPNAITHAPVSVATSIT